jgi:hypothetical protein
MSVIEAMRGERLIRTAIEAASAASQYVKVTRDAVSRKVVRNGRIANDQFDRNQRAPTGLRGLRRLASASPQPPNGRKRKRRAPR